MARASRNSNHNIAIAQPDRFAWEVFVEINKPAINRSANSNRQLVEWQTWISDITLYGDPCSTPAWPIAAESTGLKPSGLMETIKEQNPNHFQSETSPFNKEEREQVFLNKVAFDYIVSKGLWFSEGVLERAIQGDINFPEDAIIVKSNWKRIHEPEKSAYHWQYIDKKDPDSTVNRQVLVGLNAFHIIGKHLPDWLWSTFEHIDNPGRCDAIGCKDNFGADPGYVAPHRQPNVKYEPGALTPQLRAMFDAAGLDKIWQNYRLKGTQVTFTDNMGRPTLLGNSVLEPNFESTSSCMTCHTRASVSNNTTINSQTGKSSGLPVLSHFSPLQGHVGTPDPGWFQTAQAAAPVRSADIVWRTDFLWELTRVRSREETCGKSAKKP